MFTTDWAKTTPEGEPGISVRQHCHAVRCVVEELLRRFPHFGADNGLTPQHVAFLALSHDTGKISLDFLQKCLSWLRREGLEQQARNGGWAERYTRWHPAISQQSLQIFLQHCGHDLRSAYYWAAVAGAHHGQLLANGSARPCRPTPSENTLEDRRQACLTEFWEACGRPTLPPVDGDDPRLWSVAGLITLADWLGSDEAFFPPDRELPEEELRRAAGQAVAAAGLGLPPVKAGLGFTDIFPGKTPCPMQTDCAEAITSPGVYVLEAPMGMGKTEAALWAAYHLLREGQAQGIYFALPTQATSNRIFSRLADFARSICPEAAQAQLIHANAWLCEDIKTLSAPGTADPPPHGQPLRPDGLWFNTSRRALFAPFGAGTVDQALLAVLAVRHFPLRRFALSRKVVILDEVHSYDVYTGTLIRCLCRELKQLGCTVIILSATLTESARRKLLDEADDGDEDMRAPYPRLTGRANGTALAPRTPPAPPDKEICVTHARTDEARREALGLASRGAQVLWVCDTVDSAQQTFQDLKQLRGGAGVRLGLLHSRFPFYQRAALEQYWMDRFSPAGQRDGGAILVSTQIVEQSVDLDADALFSELAPTDMLLQRLGRLWRHQRTDRPVPAPLFCLLDEEAPLGELRGMDARAIKLALGAKGHVYRPWVLLRSLEQWAGLEHLSLPSGIRRLLADTYAPADCPPAWQELEEEQRGEDLAAQTIAHMGTNIWKQSLDDATVPGTRLSDHEEYTLVLCTADEGGSLSLLEGGCPVRPGTPALATARVLHRNTIRMADWHFIPRKRPRDARLAPFHIDGRILVRKDGTADAPGLKADRRLIWDAELGLAVRKEVP
ncbi:MAG: CRISPR-associated helicase Cas3' [Desulfovibrionaceae bacterium]|nr:CRISPR-associated helicase Cas3' [Desulfovibrionaceae bacterium]